MTRKKTTTEERRGTIMTIAEAKNLLYEQFAKLDDDYGGFESEKTQNHPMRKEGETFMQFIEKGSKKIKSDPAVKKILR